MFLPQENDIIPERSFMPLVNATLSLFQAVSWQFGGIQIITSLTHLYQRLLYAVFGVSSTFYLSDIVAPWQRRRASLYTRIKVATNISGTNYCIRSGTVVVRRAQGMEDAP
jgi:hypothetical protein